MVDIDTHIMTTATPKIENPTRRPYVNDTPIPIFLDAEHGGEDMHGKEGTPLYFEKAGPREHIYFEPDKTKIAIVTCGGLCPGLNDVIRAIVLEAYYGYGVRSIIGIRYGLEGFIPKYHHSVLELSPNRVTEIHTFGGTILGSSRGPQDPEEIVDALERMNVNILFVIGGDGSMKAAAAIQKEIFKRSLHIVVIGIPKTIDNDINFIPRSFGFDTAVDVATLSLRCAHTEAIGTYNGIGLVKLMGRESGFIAAHATLSLSVVNFVLVPECPFHLEGEGGLLPELEKRLNNRKHAVIVVAEGAGQDLLTSSGQTDASGNPILGDIGAFLQNAIHTYLSQRNINFSLKYIDPSYIVRSTAANTTDRVYCGQLGRNAVHAAMSGRTNMVVACLLDHYVHLPLDIVTRRRRRLDIQSDYWRSVLATTGQNLT